LPLFAGRLFLFQSGFVKQLLVSRTYFFAMAQQSLVGRGLLIIEALRSHPDTLHSVGGLL